MHGTVADTILVNGKVITVNDRFDIASGLAIAGEHILAVGSDELVRRFSGTKTRVIDLHGRAVMPGLIDGHAHLDREGLKSVFPSLGPVRSIGDIQDRIAELVRSAVGFDAKRGDKVTVETMHFLPPSAAFDEAVAIGSGGMQSWLLPVAGAIVVLLVAGAAVFIMRRRRGPVVDRLNAAIDVVAQAGQDAIAVLGVAEPLLLTNDENRAAATLNNIFDTNPEEAVALLRAWIAEGAPS